MSATMRALVARRYGPVGELRLEDVPIPSAGPGQIQVKVAAAAVNPADIRTLSGVMHRITPLAFPHIVGLEIAGTVTVTGSGVTRFAVGDEIFGLAFPRSASAAAGRIASPPSLTTGTMAEYTVLEADTPALARRPADLAADRASSLPVAGLTALPVLRTGDLDPGAAALVIGAGGGVGSVVVPLLAAAGTHVIATGPPADEPYLRGLGAAEVIDHRSADTVTETLRRHPEGVDALVNLALPGSALPAASRVLRPGGRLLNVASPGFDEAALGRDDITVRSLFTTARPGDLDRLAADAVAGILPPAIGARYRLSDGARPFTDHVDRHGRGKRVVHIDDPAS
ncbi:NADP-dependent oxidoreductase [Actinomadura sp. 9N407]|uniref:NADP-dependent oxidoreductase n=1 Tax=Actinomadura sp. 9N407 TaxID=3375154 RepID=UPI003791BC94